MSLIISALASLIVVIFAVTTVCQRKTRSIYILRQERLQSDELLFLLEDVFIPLGFSKFRLTGGEPLLYPKLVKLVEKILNFPETKDLSLTTNGFLLESLAADLFAAGLRRINISLDSLNA